MYSDTESYCTPQRILYFVLVSNKFSFSKEHPVISRVSSLHACYAGQSLAVFPQPVPSPHKINCGLFRVDSGRRFNRSADQVQIASTCRAPVVMARHGSDERLLASRV